MPSIVGKMSPTATAMIRMDHAHVMALFHKITPDTTPSVREGAVNAICAALEIHAQLEEELFYPALREQGAASEVLDKSVPEHDEMRQRIARVRELDGQRDAQDEALCTLMNAVMHHVADEETQLLPQAEKQLGQERLSQMGAEMTRRRLQLAKPRAAELAVNMAKAAPAKTALMAMGAVVAGTLLVRGLAGQRSNGHAGRS